jgi:hypothetical protein
VAGRKLTVGFSHQETIVEQALLRPTGKVVRVRRRGNVCCWLAVVACAGPDSNRCTAAGAPLLLCERPCAGWCGRRGPCCRQTRHREMQVAMAIKGKEGRLRCCSIRYLLAVLLTLGTRGAALRHNVTKPWRSSSPARLFCCHHSPPCSRCLAGLHSLLQAGQSQAAHRRVRDQPPLVSARALGWFGVGDAHWTRIVCSGAARA